MRNPHAINFRQGNQRCDTCWNRDRLKYLQHRSNKNKCSFQASINQIIIVFRRVMNNFIHINAELNLSFCPVNYRWRYKVSPPFTGWAQTLNLLCKRVCFKNIPYSNVNGGLTISVPWIKPWMWLRVTYVWLDLKSVDICYWNVFQLRGRHVS